MFRKMRRNKQELSKTETIAILENATSGVLAVSGDEGYPYAVPLSYVYHDNKIYFHCALTGHKIDAIKKNDKVSFCVIAQDDVISEKYTTFYKSVIVFGKAKILEGQDKYDAIMLLANKYSKAEPDQEKEINAGFDRLLMVMIDIEHCTGKQSKEFLNA